MYRYAAFAALLAILPACLNPDISDEYPLTMRAEALGADGGTSIDESDDDDAPTQDEDATDEEAAERDDGRELTEPDVADPGAERRARPRRAARR